MCGVVWCGVVRHGLACCGVPYGVVRSRMVLHDVEWSSVIVLCGVMRSCMVPCGVLKSCMVLCGVLRSCMVLCDALRS